MVRLELSELCVDEFDLEVLVDNIRKCPVSFPFRASRKNLFELHVPVRP